MDSCLERYCSTELIHGFRCEGYVCPCVYVPLCCAIVLTLGTPGRVPFCTWYRCNKTACARKYVHITRLPRVLCVHLQRRTLSHVTMFKDRTPIEYVGAALPAPRPPSTPPHADRHTHAVSMCSSLPSPF